MDNQVKIKLTLVIDFNVDKASPISLIGFLERTAYK